MIFSIIAPAGVVATGLKNNPQAQKSTKALRILAPEYERRVAIVASYRGSARVMKLVIRRR